MKNSFALLPVAALVLQLSMGCTATRKDGHDVVTFAVGACKVSVLSEGHNAGNQDILLGATPEILRQYAPDGTFPMGVNAFLIRTPDEKNILVDAGYGKKLLANLQTLNVSAEQVHVVLLTHLHGDHIGGLLQEGKAVFPNAEIYLSQPEYDYWTSDAEMEKVPEKRRNSFLQARNVVSAYQDKLHLFVPAEADSAGVDLLPDIRGVAAYGHTPGHTAYLLASGDSRLLIWGDLTHAMSIQMPHPEVALTFDVDPEQAIATRAIILEYVAKHKIAIAGMHIVSPAMGNVRKSETEGFVFTSYAL
jgi:glyoxylase-like metal-dependent hydrolase (beta-lactamase superfamily II)